jgi:uncharacterized repeat protein (TIGR01451 family)
MTRIAAILMAALLLIPGVVAAKPGGGVELISLVEVEVSQKNELGKEVTKRVAADKANVAPGDTVIYTITYSNNGDQPATDIAIKNPIPENMLYVDKSAEGAGARIEFSIDNGKSFSPFAALIVKNKEGRERPARANDITTVRWTLEKPLQPGTTGSVSYRAKVK